MTWLLFNKILRPSLVARVRPFWLHWTEKRLQWQKNLLIRSTPSKRISPFKKSFEGCFLTANHVFFFLRNSGLDDLLTRGGSSKSSRDSDWDMLSDFAPVSKPSQSAASYGGPISSSSNYGSSTTSGKSSSSTYGSSTKTKEFSSGGPDSGEAQKKFGSAKAISSDQYFQDSGSADVNIIPPKNNISGLTITEIFGINNCSRNEGRTCHDFRARRESLRRTISGLAIPALEVLKTRVELGTTSR